MAVIFEMEGEGIAVSREISEGAAPRVMERTMNGDDATDEMVIVTLDGDGFSYERGIPIELGIDVFEIVVRSGMAEREWDSLPDDFFQNLSDGQEFLLRILSEREGYVLNSDIRRVMEEEFDFHVEGGRGMAGILAGLTRRYSEGFRRDLIEGQWADDQAEFRLGEKYAEEVDDWLESD